MNNLKASYDKILEVLTSITKKEHFLRPNKRPKFQGTELTAINLTSEYTSIDSACQLFRVLPLDLKKHIERFVYNRRKRKLLFAIEMIRKRLSEKFNEFEDYFVLDK